MSERTPDPASEALEDAFGLAFRLLKLAMVLLLVLFVLSGLFTVAPHEVAFVARAGHLDPTPKEPGAHLALPLLDTVLRLDARPQRLTVATFDLARSDQDLLEQRTPQREGGVNPRRDGYLVTGDANLIHGAFAARIRITSPKQALLNPRDAPTLARVLLERAAVRAAAERPVDALLGPGKAAFTARIQELLQADLDRLDTGLGVDTVDLERDLIPPPQVRQAFDAVTRATQDRDRLRSEAARYAAQVDAEAQATRARILASGTARAARIVDEARADTQVLRDLRPQYARDPHAFTVRRLAQILAESLPEVEETLLVGPGPLRIRLERDTQAARAAEEDRQRQRFQETHRGQ